MSRRRRIDPQLAVAAALVGGALLIMSVAAWKLSHRSRRPPGPTALPPLIVTERGPMRVEEDYLPGVVDCELAHFTDDADALQAQAIAARTYLLRYLQARGATALIPIGPSFQCWRKPVHDAATEAARDTQGLVMRWQGQVINGNYAAGTPRLDGDCQPLSPRVHGFPHDDWDKLRAAWRKGARFGDWAWTEIFITRNRARRGGDVAPTALGSWGPPNRGALGQHATVCLAAQGRGRDEILRTFYGEDVTIGP